MHHLRRGDDVQLKPGYPQNSRSFSECHLVNQAAGSVHMGLSLCALQPGGWIDTHVHSFEESFFILEGEPTLVMNGCAHALVAGACGIVPVGVPHAWRGPSNGVAKWIDMTAPQPREETTSDDTFFVGPPEARATEPLDVRDPRSRHLFLLADVDIALENLKTGSRIDAPTVSASMATALLAYSGIAVKMLVDQRLDAQLSTMFMVEYQPGGVAHLHDHPFEESYYVLDGEVEAVADGAHYVLRRGDLFWTGVGCIHSFRNSTKRKVRWLETQAPQPPVRHSYRFSRDWEYLKQKVASALEPAGRKAE